MRDIVARELTRIYHSISVIKDAIHGVEFDKKLNLVAQVVCEVTNVSYSDLVGSARKRDIVQARILFVAASEGTGFSYKELGEFLAGRDHSTICYYKKKHQDFINLYPDYQEQFSNIITKLKEHE